MQKNIMQKADSYAGKHRRHRMWQKLMTFLGCAVVFCTTYALILPAITMEKWECGLEEHTHTEECYAVLEEQLLPQCTADLEFADIIVHHHDENCYTADGTLWCTLAETDAPTATEETPETTAEAAAENAGEAPAEDAAVTEEAEAPAEPQPVVIEHQHTEQCMSLPAEPQLICNLPAHTHTEKCKPQKVLEGPVFRRITALEELTADENYLMISEDEETGEAWLLSSGDNVKIEKETGVDADGNAVALLTLDGTVLEPEKPETLDEALLWKTEEQPLISSMDEQLVLTLTEQEDETFGVELPTAVSTLALEEEKSEPAVKVTIYAVDAQAEGDSATYNCGREDIAHTEACYDPATGELKCTNQAHTHTHTAACTETPPDDIGIVLREIADEAALNAELADKKNMGFVLLREVGNTDGVTATLNMLTNDFNYSAEGLNQYYKQIGTEELPELTTTVPLDLGADKMWTAAGNADNAFTVTDAGNKTGKATLSRESGSWKVQKLAAANEPAVFALNPEGESGFTLYAAQEIAAAASENPQCTHNPPDNCYLNTYLDSFTPSNGDNPFGGCRDFNLVLFGNMTNMGATHGSAAIMGNIIGGNKGIVYDDSSVGNYAGDHMIKIDIGLILGGSRYTSENADGSYVEGNPGKIVTKNGSIIAREDQDSYTGYKFVMHDTMSKGLTFLTDAPDQLTVEIGKGTDKKTYSILTDESTGEGICFETESETNHTHGENCVICLKTEKVKSNDGDETGTEITLDFLKMLKWGKNSNSGAQTPKAGDNIVVTYKAKVNDNALSTDVESNEAKLEFSNDPYNWTETENTPVEKTYVTDFKLDIFKYYTGENASKIALENAKFVLYRRDEDGNLTFYKYTEADKTAGTPADVSWNTVTGAWDSKGNKFNDTEFPGTSPDDCTVKTSSDQEDGKGMLFFNGLSEGTYYLHEVKAPNGYNKLKYDVKIDVSCTWTVKSGGKEPEPDWTIKFEKVEIGGSEISGGTADESYRITSEENGQYSVTSGAGDTTAGYQVENKRGIELPETGGIGTTIFYIVGSVLVLGAAVLLVTKKRMNR